MDRVVFIIFFVIAVYNNSFAQIYFDTTLLEKTIDSGSTPLLHFAFKFQNIGKSTIKITKVDTSCSCTIPKLEKISYAPNETGEINGVFNIRDRQGLQEKEIFVYTDDISQPQIKLTLKIKILNPIQIKPRLVYWEKNTQIEAKEITLIISDTKWKLSNISCDKSKFTTKDSEVNGKHTIKVIPISTKESLRDVIKIELKDDKANSKIFAIHSLIK